MKVPFDARRLVFPPVPAAVLAYGGYHLIKAFFPPQTVLLITAGGILGMFFWKIIKLYLNHKFYRICDL